MMCKLFKPCNFNENGTKTAYEMLKLRNFIFIIFCKIYAHFESMLATHFKNIRTGAVKD